MAYTTAIYLRLSVDDDNAGESDSIQNQRDLLRRFIRDDPALSSGEIIEFADDGWSGTSFERPQVKALLDLARRGGVQCIAVKDLSRWGRNYIEVSEYLEQIFPFLGIRFISVNDNYDSADYKGQTAPMDIAFTSLVHDWYCKELSMKVRQSYIAKAKKGEFAQGAAPYGFVKSAAAKKMEIDPEAAAVVRRIFALACEGLKAAKIAALLNADKIDSPVMYRRRLGREAVGYQSLVSKDGAWTETTVRRIVADERYTGVLIYGKTRSKTVGGKKSLPVPESEWIKIPGTHDAIVSEETYTNANAFIRHFSKTGVKGTRVAFIGRQKCGYCGHALRYYPAGNPYFLCQSPALNYGMGCSGDKLYLSDLNAAVLSAVKTEAAKVLGERKKRELSARRDSSDQAHIQAELKKFAAQTGLLERRSVSLYEDFADGKLDKEQYLTAKAVCADELAKAEAHAAELDTQLSISGVKAEAPSDTPLLRRIMGAESVTDEVLSLIERVIVYDAEHIEIRFTFGDANRVTR